jgi:hypothetical protein
MYGVWEGGERWDLYRTSHLSHNNEFEHIHITSWTSSELYFGIQISSRLVLLSSENSQRKAIIGAVDKVKEAYVIFLNLASLQNIPSRSNNCQSIQKIKLSVGWMKDQVTAWLDVSQSLNPNPSCQFWMVLYVLWLNRLFAGQLSRRSRCNAH